MGAGLPQSCWLLITLSFKGILAGNWSVHLSAEPICAVNGSSVLILCSYDFPQSLNETWDEGPLPAQNTSDEEQKYRVLSEMWCLGDSRCITPRYVFHSDNIFQDPAYENRVEYLGEPGSKNCSLRLSDLRESDSGTYMFYFITSHPTEKVPEQRGVQLLVTASSSEVAVLASPADDITQGQALRLACCSPAASPLANFTWNDDTGLIHTGQVWEINEMTDDQSGSYYCQMQYEETLHNSSVLPINVQYPPRNTAASTSPPGSLQDNLPVTLTCSSDANPPVEMFVWYQGAACLPSEDKSFHQGRQTVASPAGRVLNSANITVDESGLHCCVARNIHGSQTASVQLRASREMAWFRDCSAVNSLNTHPTGGTYAVIPSLSTSRKTFIIGVCIGILLALTAIAAFIIRRSRKSSRHQMYALTATSPPSL